MLVTFTGIVIEVKPLQAPYLQMLLYQLFAHKMVEKGHCRFLNEAKSVRFNIFNFIKPQIQMVNVIIIIVFQL